jgi:hypothetical protein
MVRGPWQIFFKPVIKFFLPFLPDWWAQDRFATRLSRVLPRGARTATDRNQEKNAITLALRLCSEITCYKGEGVEGKQCCAGRKYFWRCVIHYSNRCLM